MIICLPLTFAGESTTPMPESTRLVCKGSGNGLTAYYPPPSHPHSHLHLLNDGKRSPWVVLAAYCLTTHYSHTTHAGRTSIRFITARPTSLCMISRPLNWIENLI